MLGAEFMQTGCSSRRLDVAGGTSKRSVRSRALQGRNRLCRVHGLSEHAELAKREQRHPAKEGGLLLAQLLAVAVKLLQCAIHAASRWPGLFLFDCWGGKRANCQRNVFYKSFVAYVQTFWTIH